MAETFCWSGGGGGRGGGGGGGGGGGRTERDGEEPIPAVRTMYI